MLSGIYSFVAFAIITSQAALATPAPVAGPLEARTTFFTGKATFFFQGGVAGACGQVHSDQDHIVALSSDHYQNGANCGDTITIQDNKTGKSATATVADLCPGCGSSDIDLSHGLFNVFAPDSDGVFPVTWHFGN